MMILKKTHKEYQNLNHTSIIMIGKTNFPAGIKDWEKFERNIKILLLIFYLYHPMKKR